MAVKSARKKAWRLLRVAVLWASRGSAEHGLRLLRTLRRGGRSDHLRFGEREFSIQETPAFRFRTASARVLRFIPCVAVPDTPVYGEGDRYFFCGARDMDDASCARHYYAYYDVEPSECGVESHDDDGAEEELLDRAMVVEASCWNAGVNVKAEEGSGDAGVDVKAEQFIAKFHAQMKLQRQISLLQYNEMMKRSL